MENAKRKIIAFWLTHIFLRRIGKRYHGKYIVGTTAGTHVTLVNVCCTIADALANATPTVATETTGD